jgi:hypothetical protein
MPPDHSPENGADQREYPSLVGVRSRCCASFRSLRRSIDGPSVDLSMVIGARGSGGALNSTASTPSRRRRCRSSQMRTQAYLCAMDSPISPPLVVAQTVRSPSVANLRARRGFHH